METLTARGKQQPGEIQFPRNGERSIVHIPLPTHTQKGRETTKKTTGPQALELMSSQGLPALSTEYWTTRDPVRYISKIKRNQVANYCMQLPNVLCYK